MNKSGYISVFLILILIPIILGLSLIVGVSKYYQFEADLNGKVKLIANSILSRYDKELFQRYGILTTKEAFLNEEDRLAYLDVINNHLFEIEQFDIEFSENLLKISNLRDSIVKYQTNRFVYNCSKEFISAIVNQQDDSKTDFLKDFNSIAEIYEEVLEDYESLNRSLKKFREKYNNHYKMLVKDINQEEIYIVNSINGVRDLSKQKDSELKIETKIDNIKNSAKYISKKTKNATNQYKEYSNILDSILIEINTIESKVSKINQLSEKFCELETDLENDTLSTMISNSKNFNNLINDSKLKNKVRINLQKTKDIANDLKGLNLTVKVENLKYSVDYNKLKRINLKWIDKFNSDLRIISYKKLQNTDLYSLDIYQDQFEKVLGNDEDFKSLISTIKRIFNTGKVEINNKKIKASTVEKLYSTKHEFHPRNESLVNKAFVKLIIIDYVNENFNCYTAAKRAKDSYFEKSEIEYILNGKCNNKDNIKTTKRKLIALRTVFNLEYILTNSEMMNFISEITLGFSSIHPMLTPVMKIVLISTIAVSEANLDYFKLIKSEKVPLLKDRKTWSLGISSLEKIMSGSLNFEDSSNEKGLLYQHYLSILMLVNKEETITKRIGDIIQLNTLAETDKILDFAKIYQGVRIKINGEYSMVNKYNPLKINIVEEGDYQY